VAAFTSGSIDAAAMKRIGLPWSERLVRRTVLGVGSAVLAARLALQYGVAAMSNGGTHHAHYAHGSGCVARGMLCHSLFADSVKRSVHQVVHV
jgi:acetoin utilization deacetylase AcuC-like enzyme